MQDALLFEAVIKDGDCRMTPAFVGEDVLPVCYTLIGD